MWINFKEMLRYILPNKSQFNRWSLPSKLTAISAYISILSLIITIFSMVLDLDRNNGDVIAIAPGNPPGIHNQKVEDMPKKFIITIKGIPPYWKISIDGTDNPDLPERGQIKVPLSQGKHEILLLRGELSRSFTINVPQQKEIILNFWE